MIVGLLLSLQWHIDLYDALSLFQQRSIDFYLIFLSQHYIYYIQLMLSNMLAGRRQTSSNKSEPKPLIQPLKSRNPLQQGQLGVSNQTTQYFSFRIQNQTSETDSTLAWSYNIPTLNPNQRQLFLVTQEFTTILQDFVGDNYPMSISIGLRNFSGFVGWNGQPTNKIIVLNLVQIMTHTNNGITQRDLVYKSQTQAMWNLGLTRNLQLEVYVDDSTTPVSFPIQNSIALCFKVLHLAI